MQGPKARSGSHQSLPGGREFLTISTNSLAEQQAWAWWWGRWRDSQLDFGIRVDKLLGQCVLLICIYYLISEIIKNAWLTKNPIKNGQKIWIDISLKNIYKQPKNHMKRCSTSLNVGDMQIKTIVRQIWHLLGCLLKKKKKKKGKTENSKCWIGCGEVWNFVQTCWEYKMVQPLCKIVWWFLKILKRTLLITIHQLQF